MSAKVSNLPQPDTQSYRWAVPLTVIGLSLTLVTAAMLLTWATQPNRRAKITEIIGISNVNGANANSVLIDSEPTAQGGVIQTGQQVITTNAKISLRQTDNGFARLSSQSSLTLEKECIQLGDGKLLIAGTEGCIGAIAVSSANSTSSIYTLERIGSLGEIKVLSGQVEISVSTNRTIQSFSLQPNQKLTFSLTGDEIGPVRLMLPGEVEAILKGQLFQGFQTALPNQSALPGLQSAIAPSPSPSKTPPSVSKPSQVSPQPIPSAPLKQVHPPAQPQRITYSAPEANNDAQNNDILRIPRSIRRSWRPDPSDGDRPVYRRKWWRSSYSSSAYRRRTPSYSAPSYSAPSYSAPSHPTPSHPAVEAPHPSPEMPALPQVPESLPPLPDVAEPSPEAPPIHSTP